MQFNDYIFKIFSDVYFIKCGCSFKLQSILYLNFVLLEMDVNITIDELILTKFKL